MQKIGICRVESIFLTLRSRSIPRAKEFGQFTFAKTNPDNVKIDDIITLHCQDWVL